jgi:hypothetical protein
MASQYVDRLSPYVERLTALFRAHRTASISLAVLAVAVPVAVKDYFTFLSYGPGGLPYNAKGWLMSSFARLIAAETLSTSPYTNPALPLADEPPHLPPSFPPPRAGGRPNLGTHPVPQRQLDQLPAEEVRQKLVAGFAALGKRAEEKGLVEIRRSGFERHFDALYVSKERQWHTLVQQMGGEFAHIHAGLDGSIHVTLHPADCKAVVEAGWGQRHGFSGVALLRRIAGFSLPVNYVLVYAPRNGAELDIAMTIIKASIGFMTGTRADLE